MVDLAVPELVLAVEQLAMQSNGDVGELVARARLLAGDLVVARACERAGERRAQAQDRTAGWYLACMAASLRASEVSSPQDEAELTMARIFGERSRCSLALAPLPEPARWVVGGVGQPPIVPASIELARRNAGTYLERLDAELGARRSTFSERLSSATSRPVIEAAISEVLATYVTARSNARAALSRTVDHLCARGGEGEFARAGGLALAELDDVVLPALQGHIDEMFALLSPPLSTAR